MKIKPIRYMQPKSNVHDEMSTSLVIDLSYHFRDSMSSVELLRKVIASYHSRVLTISSGFFTKPDPMRIRIPARRSTRFSPL